MSFDWKHQGMKHNSRPLVDSLTPTRFTGTTSHPLRKNRSVRVPVLRWKGRFPVLFMVLLLLTCILSSQAQEETNEPAEAPQPEPTDKPTKEPTPREMEMPTQKPAPDPTKEPTPQATNEPTRHLAPDPTKEPASTPKVTDEPTGKPAQDPTKVPTRSPVTESTPKPMFESTPLPSKSPTKAPDEPDSEPPPSKSPTKAPVLDSMPMWKPTRDPAKKPTSATHPTLFPIQMATPPSTRPTPAFASDFTPAPASPSSASLPTASPTKKATTYPSPKPTSNPTREPTSNSTPAQPPTPSPTSPQTISASDAMTAPTVLAWPFLPTPPPTPFPIQMATPPLTWRPTPAFASDFTPLPAPSSASLPAASPTKKATTYPSPKPTSNPTREPTSNSTPAQPPTPSPTSPQTISASDAMTVPTVLVTGEPTEQARSEPELHVQSLDENFKMTIGGIILPLSLDEQTLLELITSDVIAEEIIGVLGADQIENLEVDASVISSSSKRMLLASGDRMKRSLKLPETNFTLHVLILIQSLIESHDVDRYIYGAFNDDEDKSMFVTALKQTGNAAFVNVDSVSVVPLPEDEDPTTQVEDPTQGMTEDPPNEDILPTSDEGFHDTAAIVVSVVIIVLAGIGLTTFFVCRGRRTTGGGSRQKVVSSSPRETFASIEQYEIGSEIELGAGSELSSLGDSIQFSFTPCCVTAEGSVNGIFGMPDNLSLDYDFQKAFGNDFTPSLVGTESNPPSLLTKDDKTLSIGYVLTKELENFEVDAPPGLLGLVLETSEEGIPTVHMIKRSSPLVGEVRVGDRLLSVDGFDVSMMWANDASCYVASKQDNPARLLVFARPFEADSSAQPKDPTDCGLEA